MGVLEACDTLSGLPDVSNDVFGFYRIGSDKVGNLRLRRRIRIQELAHSFSFKK